LSDSSDKDLDLEALLEDSAEDLYENAPCGYLSTLPDGTIIKVNQTFLAWTGYQREDLVSRKRFQDLLPVAGKIFHETHCAPMLRMQGFVREIALDLRCSDRRLLPVMMNSTQRSDADGKPLFNRITLFDATERRVYERELLLARRKAELAAKAKADLLSMLSHEIRTPLNAVVGVSHLLDKTSASPQQQKYIRILRSSSESLLHLINDILDFSKIEAGKVALEERPFNVHQTLHDLVHNLLGKAEEKNLAVHLEIDEQVPACLVGDPVKIGQVITNLLSNAIKFTPKGSVTVAAQLTELSGGVASVQFSVSDTGIGIAPDRLSQIFEEFTQGSYDIALKYGGTGLGLAINRKLLELHDSKMAVESVVGQGTTFSFPLRLKVGSPVDPPEGAEERVFEKDSLQGLRILVAEDNKINVYLLSRLLRRWGVEFDIVENGQQAVAKVTEREYDLVLMDLQMPEMNGYDATRAIRDMPDEKFRRLPMIALSASTRIGQQGRLSAQGFTDFVGKPFEPRLLFRRIAMYAPRRGAGVGGDPAQARAHARNVWDAMVFAPDFSLEGLSSGSVGGPQARAASCASALDECEASKIAFREALEAGDQLEFERQVLQLKATLELLEAHALWAALRRAGGLMAEPMRDPVRIQAAILAIDWEIDSILSALREELQKAE